MGTRSEVEQAVLWLNKQPCEHIVVVSGNHDFALEAKKPDWWSTFDWGRVQYLENSSTMIDGRLFYGSPVTPWFFDWAFNVHRGPAIAVYWDRIPNDTDILVTHGPPFGYLDQSHPGGDDSMVATDHLGCDDLLERIAELDISLHVFGHIHGGYGINTDNANTTFVNASQVNEAYKVVNKPIEVIL
jgi:Icc-related predicted phosphoesterase